MNNKHTSDADEATSSWPAPSRRNVIKAAAAIGLVGGLSERITAQDDDGADVAETFELEGETGGWVGVAPQEIEGQQNPTLVMKPGEDYEVVWVNADGASHNFAIENEDSDVFVETDYVSSIGETESATFTAEAEFDHYVCHPHRKTMRGTIVSDESELETEAETTEVQEEQEPAEEAPAEKPSAVFELALEEEQWRGEAPDEIRGKTNPTLSLEAGKTYAITWTLRTEREDHQTGYNLVIHDEEGRHLTYTEFVSEEGQGRTLVFTADEEMAYYSDQTQLGATGEIDVSGASDEETTTTTTGGG